MKKINILILFLFTSSSCKAQVTEIIPIQNHCYPSTKNVYYKDVNNLLNPFVGTWVYTNGSTKLKIILKKAVNNYNGYYREDLIYGEYQYIENGIEKINTLSEIDVIYQAQFNHSIAGNNILENNARQLPCSDCLLNQKRFLGHISDPLKDVTGRLFLRKIIVNGEPALSALIHFTGIRTTGSDASNIEQEFVGSTIPNGEYTLIKLP